MAETKPTDIQFHVDPDAWLPVAQLLTMFHPHNSQTRDRAEMDAIKRHIADEGFTAEMVVVNPWNQRIVSGHGRTTALHELGFTGTVPVVYREYTTEASHRRAMLRWNLARGHQDEAKQAAEFAALLEEFEKGDLSADFGLGDGEFDALLAEFGMGEEEAVDPGPQIDKADELREKWGVELGQLWQLGEHRLVCGDCTDAAVVERLMDGEKAEMVWTDPPYGVAVGDKNKFLNSIAPSNRIEENLENDTLDEPKLAKMLCAAFDNAMAHCTAGAAWYVAAPPGPLHILFGQVLKDRKIWRQTIQWVKNNATFSPMGVCYHWQAEPIFFGWMPNGAHRYYGGRTQTTVWEIDRPSKSPEHPTMKPVELVGRAVENSSLAGEIVYDPFAGSGTTGIACQNLGRKARMVEISPAYCAVILQRWADMTGKMPVLIDG